jgi:RNA 2',3'-cyclic 3'-phosphodiesterase
MNKSNTSEQVRTFIAIELPDQVKQGLGQLQATLKAVHPDSAKWVDPYSIHLTLKFLGNVEVGKIDAISQAILETAQSFDGFQLHISGLGAFPNLRRVQVVWVGIEGNVERLQALQKHLDSNLTQLGYLPEKRAFVPHLTLARVRDNTSSEDRLAIGDLISRTKNSSVFDVEVNSLSLMRSQLTPRGAIYSRLGSFGLKTPCH